MLLGAASVNAHCGNCAMGEDHSKSEKTGTESASMEKMAKMTIVETAANNENFSILVKAVKAADLGEALSGEGPFTVFAPTNKAFEALPKEELEALLKDKKKLTSILTYHVLQGKVKSAEVVKLDKATTLNGQEVTIKKNDDGVKIDDASVVMTDIECSNGVIHVIDKVILPKSKS
ncbi:MAG: fasciclin domain-containing protein [Candidatus Zixiibacteriota bacterium]|nr:MAG: fasciclin domain-containing protein [candidate division Zixibacteria bacterium]